MKIWVCTNSLVDECVFCMYSVKTLHSLQNKFQSHHIMTSCIYDNVYINMEVLINLMGGGGPRRSSKSGFRKISFISGHMIKPNNSAGRKHKSYSRFHISGQCK